MDVDKEIAQLAHNVQENFFAHQLFLPERLARCTVLKAQELIIINSHIADYHRNMIIRARLDDTSVAPTIVTTLNYFKREGLPFSWWIAPDDTPEKLPQLLDLNGVMHKETYYALTLDLDDVQSDQVEVHMERIRSFEQVQHALEVLYQVYGDTPQVKAWYEQLSAYDQAEDDYERWYIAYQDELPVAVVSLTIFSNVAGIHHMTIARVAHQETIQQACVAELLGYAYTLGIAHAAVVCTEDEIELYRDLGFDDLLTFERHSSS